MSRRNIALFTTWNTTCGVAQFSEFLVDALYKQNVDVHVLAACHSDRLRPIDTNPHPHQAYHQVFHSGFSKPEDYSTINDELLELIFVKNKMDACLIQYQDYLWPNKRFLNEMIAGCRYLEIPCYAILHDTCLSSDVRWAKFTGIIKPPSMEGFNLSGNDHVIDQGIPEFELGAPNLPEDCYRITCFGYGRNRIKDILSVLDTINQSKWLARPLELRIQTGRDDLYQEYCALKSEHTSIIIENRYLPAADLGRLLHDSHASIIWYPDIPGGRSTSSAFRFCMGAKVPLICNESNWVSDKMKSGGWICFTNPQHLVSQICGLFFSVYQDGLRASLEQEQERQIQESGWSRIASQYLSLIFHDKSI